MNSMAYSMMAGFLLFVVLGPIQLTIFVDAAVWALALFCALRAIKEN